MAGCETRPLRVERAKSRLPTTRCLIQTMPIFDCTLKRPTRRWTASGSSSVSNTSTWNIRRIASTITLPSRRTKMVLSPNYAAITPPTWTGRRSTDPPATTVTGLFLNGRSICIAQKRWDFVSETAQVWLTFQSDYSITGSGFHAVWSTISLPGCPHQVIEQPASGRIQSPLFPHYYLPHLNCTLRLLAPGKSSRSAC